jgi:hypothetical protein
MKLFNSPRLSWKPKQRKSYIHVVTPVDYTGKEMGMFTKSSDPKAQVLKKHLLQALNVEKVIIKKVEVEGKEGFIE